MNSRALTFKTSMQLVAVAIPLCVFPACQQYEHRKQDLTQRRHNEITKIEVATGICFGPCQRTAVSIDSSLNYGYYGDKFLINRPSDNQRIEGYYRGKITKEMWDAINVSLEKIHYKQLDSVYNGNVDDQGIEILIYFNDKVKHISATYGSLPDGTRRTFYSISRSYKSVNLTPVDTIAFGTTEQLHSSRPIHVKDIKFPPTNPNQ